MILKAVWPGYWALELQALDYRSKSQSGGCAHSNNEIRSYAGPDALLSSRVFRPHRYTPRFGQVERCSCGEKTYIHFNNFFTASIFMSIYLIYRYILFNICFTKRLWCWEGLEAGGEGDNRGWDGWMASLTWWTWVWVNSGSWWWTGRSGVLRFMGSQRVRHDWVTEMNWTYIFIYKFKCISIHTYFIQCNISIFYRFIYNFMCFNIFPFIRKLTYIGIEYWKILIRSYIQ